MNELAGLDQFGIAGDALFQPVLDGLDVVIGARFDFLHPRAVGLAEVRAQRTQLRNRFGRERPYFGNAAIGRQGEQPFDFHMHAITNQPEFAEIRTQRFERFVIAAVKRR